MKLFLSILLSIFPIATAGVILPEMAFAQVEDAKKAENQAYFSVLTDIPLMPDMEELTDQAFVFDKAEGRVVEAVGILSTFDTQRPIKFYESALTELGWKPLKTGLFQRNNEQLVVRAEKITQGVLVRFQLSPLSR